MDLLNIDQSGNKSSKSNKNKKAKPSFAGEPISVVGDLEFWTTDEDEVSKYEIRNETKWDGVLLGDECVVCDTLQVIICTCVYESFYYLNYDPEILFQNSSSMRFSHIASLHSELIAVSIDGKLHQWKWSDPMPLRSTPGHHSHSRASDMKLKDEKIIALDACNVRASVMTESGKVDIYICIFYGISFF